MNFDIIQNKFIQLIYLTLKFRVPDSREHRDFITN